jgi:anti-sigma-K factor RskA
MTNSNRPDLLGYLAGALEPDERRAVEESLRQDPSLHQELRRVRRRLEFLKDADAERNDTDFQPPPGLADRTLAFIARHAESNAGSYAELDPAGKRKWRGEAAREPLAPATQPWRFVDVAVALAVCLAGAGLVLPLLNVSRSNARIATCANNLREVGLALTQYSEHQNGFFPRVAETGRLAAGGIYAPTLLAGTYITDPRLFICPGSQLADDPSQRIPAVAEIQAASGAELDQLRRQMGGSYGYALGYRQGGVYRPTRNLYRETFALVADEPSADFSSSPNHSGKGHNVLLEDGHVVFLKACHLDGSADDIFTNDDGKAAAGCHVNDAVVVRSDVSP